MLLHFPIIVMLGMFLVASYPLNLVVMFIFYLAGVVDLTYSKLPLYRQRIWNSFGPETISMRRREAYYRGYKRIAFGGALNLLMLVHYSM
ncbi:hypothetical protein [Stieleria maiorica]|uniref:hypothetical protein n=1 Tax=Stieleria maiorica TaxID=2795974 RepID=UPI0011C787FA|nr:hypothetical protein [Stieleria maiorica]